MNSTRKYADPEGTPVPYPSYRCKARAHGKGEGSHTCKLHVDHDDAHRCVCGRKWEPLEVPV